MYKQINRSVQPHFNKIGRIVIFLALFSPALALALPSAPHPADNLKPELTLHTYLGQLAALDREIHRGLLAFAAEDYTTAINIWHTLAGLGHPSAQYYMGVAYGTGKGVPADLPLALAWWRASANQGHTDAQYNLGLIYYKGEGVAQDITQASAWWQMAAIRGDAAAQFQLGALIIIEGGSQNVNDAIAWWRKSAKQGFEPAIKALKILGTHSEPIEANNPAPEPQALPRSHHSTSSSDIVPVSGQQE